MDLFVKFKFDIQKRGEITTHMCRITIINPTYGDYYTKNWIVSKSCARIFSSSQKQEVAFLILRSA